MKTKALIISLIALITAIVLHSCTKDETKTNDPVSGSITDPRDNQTYKTVEMGDQTWFAENLSYETDTGSWLYENSAVGYGRLYNWDAAMIACPSGWHLPTDDEWIRLEMHLGMTQNEAERTGWRGTDEGRKLKSSGGWDEMPNGDNGNGIDSYEFSVLPAGHRQPPHYFDFLGTHAYFWADRSSLNNLKYYRLFQNEFDMIERMYNDPGAHAYSVRCVKD